MKILSLSIGAMIMRLHAITAIVVTLGFLGFLYLGIVIGVVIFFTTLMGIKWSDIKKLNPFRHVTKQHDYDWHRHHRPVHH